jgi:hypothetical protein
MYSRHQQQEQRTDSATRTVSARTMRSLAP